MIKIILSCIIIFTFITKDILSQISVIYPLTKKTEHTDLYFGTTVSDPYSWMEDMQSTEVKQWITDENVVTEDYFSKIPYREEIKNRLTELWNYPRYSSPFKAGDYYFYYKNDGLQNQSVLYRELGLDGTPEIFLDPNTLSADGTVALGATSVSWDNKYFAYAINRAGSDWQEIYVMDIASKEKLSDQLLHVKFSDMNWYGDGFYYVRFDDFAGDKLKEKNELPKIYFHRIGTQQSEDQLNLEDKDNPERFMGLFTTEDQTLLFKYIGEKNATGNQLYFKDLKFDNQRFQAISDSFNDQYSVIDVNENEIYIKTNKDSPNGKVVTYNITTGQFRDLISQTKDAMKDVNFVGEKFIVEYLHDAHSKVMIYDKSGSFENEISFPTVGSSNGFSGRKTDKEIFYIFNSMNYPPAIYKYNISSRTSSLFRKSEMDFDPDEYVSKEIFYPSKDGTMIPMFMVYQKGLELNGNNPVLLYGYGGFNVSSTPTFSSTRRVFLEKGGIFALACIRGGGEYGEEWHKAGMQLNKQNVFDDFIAAAEYLIREKYTSSEKIAIQGGSNGGLLIGAVINQSPDLFKVAIPQVGVMDMLKFHKFTIGWAWVTDYGSSDDSINFFNLYKYSPLQNIKPQNYPATLITTSDHDDRVVPLHSYKYAATLQENNTGVNPVLIRVDTDAGHGGGKPTSKSINEQTDIWSFVFFNLGMSY